MKAIGIEEIENTVIITLSGEITLLTVKDIENSTHKYINSGLKAMAFDFRNVQFIDSFGISRIIKQSKAFTDKGTEFVLINMNDNIRQTFKIATFDRLFTIITKAEFIKRYLSN